MKTAAYFLIFLLFAHSAVATDDKNATEILQSSDRARGGGLPGIAWKVKVDSIEKGKKQDSTLEVKANTQGSLVRYLSPPRVSGQKLLMTGKNMWFQEPGVQRPVPISPRQKLSGQAAYGDIAATNYATDYAASYQRDEACGQDQCAVLSLKAVTKGVTYDQITYWISVRRRVGLKAEFYSVSGKLFKSATFDYDNRIAYKGAQVPFVSRMVITDAVTEGNVTTLDYSDVRVASLSPSEFNVDLLAR